MGKDTGDQMQGDRTTGFPDLFLMRHGETVWNREDRMQGRLDSPLTGLGIRQAQRQGAIVRDILARRSDLGIWSSPLGRARQTAEIVFGDAAIRFDPRLSEIDIGGFSGRLRADCASGQDAPETRFSWYDRTPGGERISQVETRIRSFLKDLPGPALVMTHGITLCVIQAVATGLPLSDIGDLPMQQGTVHAISNGRFRLIG